jgi:hypothetical protein
MASIKEQLGQELATIEWSELIPHAQRDAIIIVNESLDLLEVGVAIAEDNTVLVQRWVDEQLICKPSSSELSDWNSNPQKRSNTFIVQPFVLISNS